MSTPTGPPPESAVKRRRRPSSLLWMMAVVAAYAVEFSYHAAREARDRALRDAQCLGNLKLVAWGLSNYCDLYGRFPPPSIADARGRRAHSWRILALPVHPRAHDQPRRYDYAGAWDDPGHAGMAEAVPSDLTCPAERRNPHGSPFVMFNDLSGADPRAIPGDVILAVEWWGANRSWLDPNDRVVLGPAPRVPATDHAEGFGVVLRDFTVERVRDPSRIVEVGGYYVLKGHRREPK